MGKTVAIYAFVLALAAFALDWLEFRYAARVFTTEIYVSFLALAFAGLGLWVGLKLTSPLRLTVFRKNAAALEHLNVSEREYAVLELLAAGQSNKEIARTLGISPNTVKTHIARLFSKLEVERRTQAIQKAKTLHLIP